MIDSHCHLDHEPLFGNLDEIIKRAKLIGISKLLTICTTFSSFEKIKSIIEQDKIIFGTFGIHPHETKTDFVNKKAIVKNVKENQKIIGVGETGLDFFRNLSTLEEQIFAFEEQIKLSTQSNGPFLCREDLRLQKCYLYDFLYFPRFRNLAPRDP